ncbi:universal stress protein [Ktedonobacter robiniae]|uniref:Universal stress protein UspA n=1 Tax=Ktedonobacter robiniae TaxID=2778365 RepID=A0ABQ3UH24_9CHLR|nr:universal stress protein [Ktedonobacter robiniae]GHO51875.1 universal stress protein UspA [Ktedonobacter robiniae]
MFKRILVPLDGSPRAERALPLAKRVARATRGSIVLVYVVDPVSDLWAVEQAPLVEMRLREAEMYLNSLLSPAPAGEEAEITEPPIPTEMLLLRGSAAASILNAASETQADGIVMCSHGQNAASHWRIGGVAAKVVRHAKVPVLMLKEEGGVPAGPHPDATEPLRVLVPLDGSAPARTALTSAASLLANLAPQTPAQLHLLHVIPANVQLLENEGRRHELVQKAGEYLQSMTKKVKESLVEPSLSPKNFMVTWSVILDNDVANAIVRVAEHGDTQDGLGSMPRCDGIAMATHGLSGIRRWAMGSVTERVLHGTRLPLLITRPAWVGEHAGEEETEEET